jgi:hypothetical protein
MARPSTRRGYTDRMGFYYGSGAPPPEEKEGSLKEALLITWVVMKSLALPLGVLFGGIIALGFVIFLFTLSGWAGLGAIALVVVAVAARALWEWRHPPTLSE